MWQSREREQLGFVPPAIISLSFSSPQIEHKTARQFLGFCAKESNLRIYSQALCQSGIGPIAEGKQGSDACGLPHFEKVVVMNP
jgi:hypothetical protein